MVNSLKELLEYDIDYKTRQRGYGQGEIRIGHNLEIDPGSIYTIAFVSQFNPEIMDPLFDLAHGCLKEELGEEGVESTHRAGLGFSINQELS